LGHEGRVRSLSIDPTGRWLATGCDDGRVRLWHLDTGRCVRSWAMPSTLGGDGAGAEAVVRCVAWCPNPAIQVIAVAAGSALHLIYPGTCTADTAQTTFDALTGARRSADAAATRLTTDGAPVKRSSSGADGDDDEGTTDEEDAATGTAEASTEASTGCIWLQVPGLTSASMLLPALGRSEAELAVWSSIKVTVAHPHDPRHVAWHRKGDYIVTTAHAAAADAVQVCVVVARLGAHWRAPSNCPYLACTLFTGSSTVSARISSAVFQVAWTASGGCISSSETAAVRCKPTQCACIRSDEAST
jgi:ribosome biogenesis protein ERB1